MAFNAATEWEVRTTGSDANGGGFNTSSTGTDYSQQNSPQVVFTDLVIGATTTQLTSAANPFNATDVGNVINITGGTGFTVQRVQIVSVSGVTATCDKSCGTAASTGGSGNLGGGLLTVGQSSLVAGANNTVWIQSGTYNISALVTFTISSSASLLIEGYQSAHGDNGTAPVINATTSAQAVSFAGGSTVYTVQNVSFTTSSGTKGDCIHNGAAANIIYLRKVSITGFNIGLAGASGAVGTTAAAFIINECIILNSVTNAINMGGQPVILNSVIAGSTGVQVLFQNGTVQATMSNCLIYGGGSVGIEISSLNVCAAMMNNCTIANNALDGIDYVASSVGPFTVENCIIYGNGRFGINVATSQGRLPYCRNNAYGANTSGNLHNITAGLGDVTLTSNPFTNSGSGDYSLNSTSGGGASCKGTAYPGAFPGGLTIGSTDIGAVQSAAGGPPPTSTGGSYAYV